MFMDVTNKKIAATQFGIFLSLGNIGYFGVIAATGIIIASVGFDGLFLILALLLIPSLIIMRIIKYIK